ncbi:MAG: hypothetical protein ACOYK9_02040 [Chlamydiia bacterium]
MKIHNFMGMLSPFSSNDPTQKDFEKLKKFTAGAILVDTAFALMVQIHSIATNSEFSWSQPSKAVRLLKICREISFSAVFLSTLASVIEACRVYTSKKSAAKVTCKSE